MYSVFQLSPLFATTNISSHLETSKCFSFLLLLLNMRYFFSSRRASFLYHCSLVGTSCWHNKPSPSLFSSLLFSTRSHRVLTERLNPSLLTGLIPRISHFVGLPRCVTPGWGNATKGVNLFYALDSEPPSLRKGNIGHPVVHISTLLTKQVQLVQGWIFPSILVGILQEKK